MAKLLTHQLDRRFGPLSKAAQKRISTASQVELEQWAVRVPDAKKLADVFASS